MGSINRLLKGPLRIVQNVFHVWPRNYALISGPPRSGTTAMQEWLGQQPGVAGFGETHLLITAYRLIEEANKYKAMKAHKEVIIHHARRMVHQYYSNQRILLGRHLVFEKTPLEPIAFPVLDYRKFLAEVRHLFPKIRFLFLLRDPVSTINSMTQREWGGSRINFPKRRFTVEDHIQQWCAAADSVLSYTEDSNTYICPYHRLFQDPGEESERIAEFLKIDQVFSFEPKPTQPIQLSESDKKNILEATQSQMESLETHGYSVSDNK